MSTIINVVEKSVMTFESEDLSVTMEKDENRRFCHDWRYAMSNLKSSSEAYRHS